MSAEQRPGLPAAIALLVSRAIALGWSVDLEAQGGAIVATLCDPNGTVCEARDSGEAIALLGRIDQTVAQLAVTVHVDTTAVVTAYCPNCDALLVNQPYATYATAPPLRRCGDCGALYRSPVIAGMIVVGGPE